MDQEQGALPVGVKPSTSEAATNGTNVDYPDSNTSSDIGYRKLAKFIAKSPDIAIFRKFGLLNMINLLRLQAELHDLEQQLEDVWVEDRDSGDQIRSLYGVSFRLMRQYAEDGDSTQYDLLVEIGKKLNEYSIRTSCTEILQSQSANTPADEALQHVLSLDKAARPTKSDLEFFRVWLDRDTMGNNFLTGVEATMWSGANQDDLITIQSPPEEADKFTKFLNGTLLDVYNAVFGRFSKVRTRLYEAQFIFGRN
jgi:hypothetical protein